LDRIATDTTDIRPLSPAMRRRWEAAKRTGKKVGRPKKSLNEKSRIVPVSIDPALLEQVDRYARTAGISRSRLVVEGLRLRIDGCKA
jgi:hypothetical protein